jgi:hypothetical protein
MGAGGDGPALRIDEFLKIGKSYNCETFGSPSFTGRTEDADCESFEIADVELHLF